MMRSTSTSSLVCTAVLLSFASAVTAAEEPPCFHKGDIKASDWIPRCDKAIAGETDRKRLAGLRFARAYVAVEQYRYEDALADLNEALKADPDCADCLHERAYLNGELGEYAAAISDLDREIQFRPDSEPAYRERAFARGFSGDLEGAYRDRVKAAELAHESPSSLNARGEAALWIGRFDDASADFARAETLARKSGDEDTRAEAAERRESVSIWRAFSGDKEAAGRCITQDLNTKDPKATALIGECTQAFLAARDGAAKAEALTTRSTAWIVATNSWDQATADRRIAVGLDPENPERRINLGFAYIAVRHSRAAIAEFDRALSKGPNWLALAGRARANLNVGDADGAEADAIASMKLELNPAAAWVLGDIAFGRDDKERARGMYLAVYQMGSRDDNLIARLKEVGVSDPDKASAEAAK